jgi:hypothetical protein
VKPTVLAAALIASIIRQMVWWQGIVCSVWTLALPKVAVFGYHGVP